MNVVDTPSKGLRVPASRLDWIEVGRGVAAITVVCSHMPPISNFVWTATYGLGAMGVEFFFLLSGFIMLHVHHDDLGRRHALDRFLWRRAGRIFPTYWLVLLLFLVVDALLVSAPYRAEIDSGFLFRQITLAPGASLFIGPAWTLRHEILFYAIFSTLILDRRLGITVLSIWMIAVIFALPVTGPVMAPTHDARDVVLHHYNLDFALGMIAAVSLRRGVLRPMTMAASLITALLIATWYLDGFIPGTWAHVLTFKAAFFTVLILAITASLSKHRAPRFLLLMGAASYSIYLINRMMGFNLERIVRRLSLDDKVGEWLLFPVFVCSAILAGVVIYAFFERPVLRWVAVHSPHRDRQGGRRV